MRVESGCAWLRTGDLGALDPDGYLRIIDRKRDVIETSGGESAATSLVESAMRRFPFVREIIVVGEGARTSPHCSGRIRGSKRV